MSTIEEILHVISKEMRLTFEKASMKYKTPDDIAQHREEAVKKVLRDYFPSSYQFGKGEIIDSNSNRSGQVDVVICTPFHPFTVSDHATNLFFAEGVACAIEVKSDLSNGNGLKRGLQQISKVKKLERKPTPGDLMLGNRYDQERLKRIPSVLFSYKAPSLGTLKASIIETHNSLGIPIEEQVDAIVVLDKGIMYNIKDSRDRLMVAVSGERKLGLVGFEWKGKTLMGFLLYLSQIVPWEIRMAPIVQLYTGALKMVSGKVV